VNIIEVFGNNEGNILPRERNFTLLQIDKYFLLLLLIFAFSGSLRTVRKSLQENTVIFIETGNYFVIEDRCTKYIIRHLFHLPLHYYHENSVKRKCFCRASYNFNKLANEQIITISGLQCHIFIKQYLRLTGKYHLLTSDENVKNKLYIYSQRKSFAISRNHSNLSPNQRMYIVLLVGTLRARTLYP